MCVVWGELLSSLPQFLFPKNVLWRGEGQGGWRTLAKPFSECQSCTDLGRYLSQMGEGRQSPRRGRLLPGIPHTLLSQPVTTCLSLRDSGRSWCGVQAPCAPEPGVAPSRECWVTEQCETETGRGADFSRGRGRELTRGSWICFLSSHWWLLAGGPQKVGRESVASLSRHLCPSTCPQVTADHHLSPSR